MTGELAALGAAAAWAATALAIEGGARRIGSLTINLVRLIFGFAFLSLAGLLARGIPLPVDATAHNWAWLAASGLVGFTFGDLCLYRAYVVLGPRLSSLMMALVPPITALIGWAALGETLTRRDLLGMTLTIVGIGWAILERGRGIEANTESGPLSISFAGVALGFGGALGQAVGLILSKIGMAGYNVFAANQVRVLAGAVGYALLFFALKWWPNVRTGIRDGKALGFSALGAFFGPFLGVSLSLIAVRETVAGVAASIMALTPVLIIPLVIVLKKERVGLGGFVGALVAVVGVALLFL
ncbi:MAG TPA: DMT family transporter [Thermoanaerobaculia bacterium]|jgi:drug/metabolite transporter (DMT)-like permease|nr:DMT family transporter [Thermoanaerobaculia bacterium]